MNDFLEKAAIIHKNGYSYHIEGDFILNSKIKISCKKCGHIWTTIAAKHLSPRSRCAHCGGKKDKVTKGEISCRKALEKLNIRYQEQYSIPTMKSKRFDFFFISGDIKYLLEFDGKQHFKYTKFFHKDPEGFLESQIADAQKTCEAIINGYHVIRIDYTNKRRIMRHLNEALKKSPFLYISSRKLYGYLLSLLEIESHENIF